MSAPTKALDRVHMQAAIVRGPYIQKYFKLKNLSEPARDLDSD